MKDDDLDDDEEIERIIQHIHKKSSSDDFLKEIGISGVNKSIYLKSNQRSDSLNNMVELGLKTLNKLDKEDK